MISDLIDSVINWIGDIFDFLSSWSIFGGVNFLGLVIFFAITGMIVNVFVGRGST